MTIFLLLLAGLAVWGVAASLVVAARDGYRRQPVRTARDDWAFVGDRVDAGPSDLAASQWLPDRSPVGHGREHRSGHPAGVMLLRPW